MLFYAEHCWPTALPRSAFSESVKIASCARRGIERLRRPGCDGVTITERRQGYRVAKLQMSDFEFTFFCPVAARAPAICGSNSLALAPSALPTPVQRVTKSARWRPARAKASSACAARAATVSPSLWGGRGTGLAFSCFYLILI